MEFICEGIVVRRGDVGEAEIGPPNQQQISQVEVGEIQLGLAFGI